MMKMKIKFNYAVIAAILFAGEIPGLSQPTNGSSRLDFNSFKIVSERNIFNPNRSARRAENAPVRRTPKVESFALAGTMSYEKGDFAFFDGTSSQLRKTVQPGDSFAGFKVLEVTPKGVKLGTATNQIDLSVGSQLRREDEGPWASSARSESFSSGSNRSSQSAAPSPSSGTTNAEAPSAPAPETAPAASSGSEDEILKKLMQKREQELNNP